MTTDQERTMTEPTESAAYAESPPRQLLWLCETCGQPIADGEGYLHVDLDEVRHATDAGAKVNREGTVDVAALLDVPDVHWRTHHGRCDPRPESNDYCIAVERARDHADLLARTAHLSGKRWIDVTDWYDLMARMAAIEITDARPPEDVRESLTIQMVGLVAADPADPGVEVHLRCQGATDAIWATALAEATRILTTTPNGA